MNIVFAIIDYLAIQIYRNEILALLYLALNTKSYGLVVNGFFPSPLSSTFVFFIVWFLRFKKPEDISIKWYEKVFCSIFSIFMLVASSFDATDSAVFITSSAISLIFFLLSSVLLTIFTVHLLRWIKYLAKWLLQHIQDEKLVQTKWYQLYQKHPFWVSFGIIMLLWLPYAIIRYPMVSEWDAYHQMLEGLGREKINITWPIASTMFFGKVLQFGMNLFHSNSVAGFMLVLCQMVICALCLSYSVYVVCKMKVSATFKVLVPLIYGVATIYPRYLTAIVKDAIFSCMVVWFIAIFIEIFLLQEHQKKKYAMLVLSAFLMGISRSNGIYILYFTLVGVLIYALMQKDKKNLILSGMMVLSVVLLKGYSAFIQMKGIGKPPIAEALSIPFQQTARVVRDFSGDITPKEKEVISRVLNYDAIGERYHPRLSDNVKGTYHGTPEDLKAYFGIWLKMFFKHPLTYVYATFNNAFEYFYPGAIEEESGLYIRTNNSEKDKLFDESVMHPNGKKALSIYINCFENMPIVSIFCDSGVCFWVMLYLFMYFVFEKKGKGIVLILPSIVGILVCIAGPTYTWNGLRYALPVIYAMPMYLVSFMHNHACENGQQIKKEELK